ncbi:hypothetical protein EDD86DRAFT_260929 [Gorgonomyces haynaldii]|nr:hypothetical protein EDD86DRAFT_260929 [Gorgonomyces haynaldii]
MKQTILNLQDNLLLESQWDKQFVKRQLLQSHLQLCLGLFLFVFYQVYVLPKHLLPVYESLDTARYIGSVISFLFYTPILGAFTCILQLLWYENIQYTLAYSTSTPRRIFDLSSLSFAESVLPFFKTSGFLNALLIVGLNLLMDTLGTQTNILNSIQRLERQVTQPNVFNSFRLADGQDLQNAFQSSDLISSWFVSQIPKYVSNVTADKWRIMVPENLTSAYRLELYSFGVYVNCSVNVPAQIITTTRGMQWTPTDNGNLLFQKTSIALSWSNSTLFVPLTQQSKTQIGSVTGNDQQSTNYGYVLFLFKDGTPIVPGGPSGTLCQWQTFQGRMILSNPLGVNQPQTSVVFQEPNDRKSSVLFDSTQILAKATTNFQSIVDFTLFSGSQQREIERAVERVLFTVASQLGTPDPQSTRAYGFQTVFEIQPLELKTVLIITATCAVVFSLLTLKYYHGSHQWWSCGGRMSCFHWHHILNGPEWQFISSFGFVDTLRDLHQPLVVLKQTETAIKLQKAAPK